MKVGDIVSFRDFAGRLWTQGLVLAIRPEGIYVRWPDGVPAVFGHRHARYLHIDNQGDLAA